MTDLETLKTEVAKILEHEEGFRSHVYEDTLGFATIGIGRCIHGGVGVGLSYSEAVYLLKNDVFRCVTELENAFSWFKNTDHERQKILVCLVFQLGLPKLKRFKLMLEAFESQNYESAALELLDSRFAREQVPARAKRIADAIRTGTA